MRIARVMTRLNLGGPGRQVLASDPRLVARGHELKVLAGSPEPGEGDLFDELARRGVDVVRVPGLGRGVSPVGDLRALAALRRELRAFRPDVLHTHASKAGTLGRLALPRNSGAARVHTFHGHVLEGYFGKGVSRRLAAHERRMARGTQRVLAVSHATADDLVRLGVAPEEKLVVVPPGVELDELLALDARPGALRRLVGAGEEDLLVGVVGRLAEVKRPELALEAFLTIARRHPRAHLVFIGDGPLRRVLTARIGALGGGELARGEPGESAPDKGLSSRVHLTGILEDPVTVFGDLDLVLLSSRAEGLPVALIEAAAAAKPVVAMDVGGVSELVAHERTGLLGKDADELAYGLDRLLSDPRARKEMGRRARLRVRDRYSAEALADRLEAVYRAVVEERARIS